MADYPNRIRELRVARNWSQDLLAAAVGCTKSQISDLERGKRNLTVDWMRRVADALEVSSADLLSRADHPLLLSEAERALIARYRAGTPEQQESLERVTEALIPYAGPAADEKEERERAA